MNRIIITLLALAALCAALSAQTVNFDDAWSEQGFSLAAQSAAGVNIDYSIETLTFSDIVINGKAMTEVTIPGVILPNDEGAPNLPGDGRWIALPEDAKASFTITASRVETYYDIDISPAPRIPLETEDGLEYKANDAIYGKDAFYPTSPVMMSDPTELRGVDAVILGVTPFQYNPVTRELRVYRDLQIRVDFLGGAGKFGEARLRSKWWDPILNAAFINHESLPDVSHETARNTRTPDYDYIILTPNRTDYINWANTLAAVRTKQGINTGVVTTSDIGGNTAANIETYIDNAYNNWDIAPSALLILGDYGTASGQITSPTWDSYCISDNFYADVDGDDLPDIAVARMTANNESELAIMMNKAINYEYTPPTNPGFYSNPVIAGGWQTERWFILCTETVHGFLTNELNKTPVREYAIYEGSNTTWSSAPNTGTVTNYFGPGGLGYIPSSPSYLNDWGGNATRINNDLNAGAFMLLHRDHGGEDGWGEPDYDKYDLPGLVDNDPVWVFSINCLTGKFNDSSECFAEAFHRHEDRALGIIAATESSYSFVNDTYIWGMMDFFWPEFMPVNGAAGPHNLLPAFGNAYGKIFLAGSSWPYNTDSKEVTYYLFHTHGDAFTRLYEEVPQALTISHANSVESGAMTFVVNANVGADICLSSGGEIIGQAVGTGAPVAIGIAPQYPPATVDVTVTLQNYERYETNLYVAQSGPPQPNIIVAPVSLDFGDLPVGMSQTETFTINNAGNEPLVGTITTPDGFNVSQNRVIQRNLVNFNIPAYTSVDYDLVFAPTSGEDYSDNVVIASNDPDEPTVNLAITASGYEPCDIDVTPASITSILMMGQSETQTLTIANTGVADLNYQVDLDFNPSTRDVIVSTGFEEIAFPPAGWSSQILNENVDWKHSGDAMHMGTYSALADWSDMYDARLISPAFEVPEDCELSFWIRTQDTPDYGGNFDIEVSTDGSAWASIATWNQDNWSTSWSEEIITTALQAYAGQTIQLGFRAWNNYYADGVYIDDIAVTGTPYPTDWLRVNGTTSLSGSVASGLDNDLNVSFDTTDLPYGVYYANIDVQSDDPDEPLVSVPVTLSVSEGVPAISVSPASLAYGVVRVGESSTMQVTVSNPGTGTLVGLIQTPDGYEIDIASEATLTSQTEERKENAAPQQRFDDEMFEIGPGGSETYDITFSPTEATNYSGVIIIEHNAGPNEYVTLSGDGGQPQIAVSLDSLYALQNADDIVDYPVTVTNTGAYDLTWAAFQQPNQARGRDLFGYSWLDSNDTNGPTYNWIDIASTGTAIALSDDDSLVIALPFDFPFYGVDHNSIIVSSNGYLTFGSDGSDWSNDPIPSSTDPNDIICPMWDDYKPIGIDNGYDWGTVYYQIDAVNERLIVQYENVAHYSQTTPAYWDTFEVILWSNGKMLFQYENLELSTSCTVGIENSDASDGVEIVNDGTYLTNGMAIQIDPPVVEEPWLSISPENGVVAPGMSQDIVLTIDTAGLAENTQYSTNLMVNSDDPETSAILIPIDLDVQFFPDPPSNVKVEIVNGDAVLSWDPVPNANFYTVYYSDNSVTFYEYLDTTETSVTIPTLGTYLRFYFYVTAQ